jgi:hypothetical protein
MQLGARERRGHTLSFEARHAAMVRRPHLPPEHFDAVMTVHPAQDVWALGEILTKYFNHLWSKIVDDDRWVKRMAQCKSANPYARPSTGELMKVLAKFKSRNGLKG